ncbi:MAG: phosphoribosylglycinamide formyltransferase [Flavobacteriales bacterium]|nr:phosphoribosylglycinamide formyltransferase [Flavobacteriales bacterium]
MQNIAIFASGNGTNAENICNHFFSSKKFRVVLVCSNNKRALVLKKAAKLQIETFLFTKHSLENSFVVEESLENLSVDIIVLAGFLLKIPSRLVSLYRNKIINLHPSLLPKYGGKGMYGINVHREVVKNGERESGITIHLVNEAYDSGKVVYQKTVPVSENETAESLLAKIQKLEYLYYPKIIETTF